MQTFLPYPSFIETFSCLDYRRLGKQRVESFQIIQILSEKLPKINHPAIQMWKGYIPALTEYYNFNLVEWEKRGYKNEKLKLLPVDYSKQITYPSWLGNNVFHSSHRSNLLRKDPTYYSKFNWTEKPNMPYYWPVC